MILDVQGTRAVEELMRRLASEYTIVIVTRNMAQARRISEDCGLCCTGKFSRAAVSNRSSAIPGKTGHGCMFRGVTDS